MKVIRVVLPVMTIALVAFIWLHSAMPADISSTESGFLLELLNNIPIFSNITEYALRKMAHFTEYTVLGAFVWMDLHLYRRNTIIFSLVGLYICLLIALTDELIQLFSIGRSSLVTDIVIDHVGSIFGMCFIALSGILLKRVKRNY